MEGMQGTLQCSNAQHCSEWCKCNHTIGIWNYSLRWWSDIWQWDNTLILDTACLWKIPNRGIYLSLQMPVLTVTLVPCEYSHFSSRYSIFQFLLWFEWTWSSVLYKWLLFPAWYPLGAMYVSQVDIFIVDLLYICIHLAAIIWLYFLGMKAVGVRQTLKSLT